MTIQSCMGGGCLKRKSCVNYQAASPLQEPEERLCQPGRDGVGLDHFVVFHRPSGTWERVGIPSPLIAQAHPFHV